MLYSGEAEVLLRMYSDTHRKTSVSRKRSVLMLHYERMYSTFAKVACFKFIPALFERALDLQILRLSAAAHYLAVSAASRAQTPSESGQHAISAGVPHLHADHLLMMLAETRYSAIRSELAA